MYYSIEPAQFAQSVYWHINRHVTNYLHIKNAEGKTKHCKSVTLNGSAAGFLQQSVSRCSKTVFVFFLKKSSTFTVPTYVV